MNIPQPNLPSYVYVDKALTDISKLMELKEKKNETN